MAINKMNIVGSPYFTQLQGVSSGSYQTNFNNNAFVQNDIANDTFEYEENSPNKKAYIEQLKQEIRETKAQQGIIGKLWDDFKNFTNIGKSSAKAFKAIDKYELGEISQEELYSAINGYKEGQKQSVDMIADILSGIASFGSFALATGVGLAASPFTGGASLGLVAAGFGIAGFSGAAVKVGIKGLDCLVGQRKYDSLGYDLATGGINGIFAPITAGIGGAAGKAVAGKLGITALREGGEVAVKKALEGTAKGALAKTFLTTNVKYVGGSLGARALAMGTDMAVNGAITGAVDSGTRYLAGDSENKSAEGFIQEVGAGTLGGLIMAPIVGGGMRVLGNGVGKLTGKLETKVSTNYTKAVNAQMNTPTIENPDLEILKGFGNIVKHFQDIADETNIKGSDLLDGLSKFLGDANENFSGIIGNLSTLNSEINTLSSENRAIIQEILEEFAQGKDVTSKVAQLSQKSISLSELIDNKIGTFSDDLAKKLSNVSSASDAFNQQTISKINITKKTLADLNNLVQEIAEQTKKLPDTNAYKQLGDLPDRINSLYVLLTSDANQVENIAQAAKKKILSGNIQEGLNDLMRYYDEVNIFNEKFMQEITTMQSSASRSGILESADILKQRLAQLKLNSAFQNLENGNLKFEAMVENSNILLAKFAQTFSSDETLPSEIQKVLKQFTSKCYVSRSIEEAQNITDELYGKGKYIIQKTLKAGTIGETYIAKTADNKEVILKMVKEGVSKEKFAQDRAMFTKYVNEFVSDATEREYKLNLINSLFDAWNKELDYGIEAQNAKNLADNVKRFSVAQTLAVGSKNGQNISMVQEKANGIALDELLEMIGEFKKDKNNYLTKYAKEIEKNPALKNPNDWMNDLGIAYQKAQNEQAMFIGKSGTRTIHADPHTGNVFIDFDSANKPKIVYIDAGNVVERTNSQTLQDIALSLNMMIGNSQGIADAMLEGAILPSGADKAKIAQRFSQLLNERLYQAGVDVKNTKYTQSTINNIMKELNIIPNSGNSNLMKATLQRIETSRAINNVCGISSSKVVDIKDLGSGILKSLKANPKETMETIKPIIKWAYQNNDQAMITFFQMIIKKANIDPATIAA